MTFQEIADGTLLIESGESRGSGFQFEEPDIVLTNAHVVYPSICEGEAAFAATEDGERVGLDLLEYSPESQYDFAIFRTASALPGSRTVLTADATQPNRGENVLFAGFPHGIEDLLVQQAPVSGPAEPHGFYIDGSVNGGNSGGPIVSTETNGVVGIVTQRRFLGQIDMDEVTRDLGEVNEHFQAMGGSAGVAISGIDFGEFARLMSESISVINSVVQANANAGIGIGFHIHHAAKRYEESIQ